MCVCFVCLKNGSICRQNWKLFYVIWYALSNGYNESIDSLEIDTLQIYTLHLFCTITQMGE